jgi:ABC-type glycerol-3-phosphate transport system substrate-binding protein
MKIRKAIAIVVLAAGLAACGLADLISNGLLSYTKAVGEVGFKWHNGSFQSVTVTFPRVYAGKPLGELADAVRKVVAKEFKQTPDTILLAFSLDK